MNSWHGLVLALKSTRPFSKCTKFVASLIQNGILIQKKVK